MRPTMRLGDLDASTNEISGVVLNSAVEIQKALGPGLLERAYVECLAHRLAKAGFVVEREVALDLVFEDLRIPAAYRMDLWIERQVVVEVKAIDRVVPAHEAQLLTYLRLSGTRLGILLNFNRYPIVDDGFRRFVV